MNMPVLVDWLTLALGPITLIALGLSVYARVSTPNVAGTQLPTWGRVAQSVAIVSGLFLVLIRVVWGG